MCRPCDRSKDIPVSRFITVSNRTPILQFILIPCIPTTLYTVFPFPNIFIHSSLPLRYSTIGHSSSTYIFLFLFFFPHFIAYYLLYYLRPLFLSFFFLTPFPQAPRVGRRAFTTRRSSRCPTFSPLTAFSPFLSLYILDLANTKYERIRQRPPVLLRSYAFFSLK